MDITEIIEYYKNRISELEKEYSVEDYMEIMNVRYRTECEVMHGFVIKLEQSKSEGEGKEFVCSACELKFNGKKCIVCEECEDTVKQINDI